MTLEEERKALEEQRRTLERERREFTRRGGVEDRRLGQLFRSEAFQYEI